jgi:hypothetical protein
MSEVKVLITLVGVLAVVLLLLLALCHFMGLWTWSVAWLLSSREEKIGLTRAMGHYNANGYLVRRLLPDSRSSKINKSTRNVGTIRRWTISGLDVPSQHFKPCVCKIDTF